MIGPTATRMPTTRPPAPTPTPGAASLAAPGLSRAALAKWDAAVRTFEANRDAPSVVKQGDDWYAYNLAPFLADIQAEREWLAAAGFNAATPFATALPDKWTREAG